MSYLFLVPVVASIVSSFCERAHAGRWERLWTSKAHVASTLVCCWVNKWHVWNTQIDVELLTASPAANGFFGAGGVSGWIPRVYSMLEQATWRRLTRLWARGSASAGCACAPKRLLEYARPGWEFHAKGIWCAAAAARQPFLPQFRLLLNAWLQGGLTRAGVNRGVTCQVHVMYVWRIACEHERQGLTPGHWEQGANVKGTQ